MVQKKYGAVVSSPIHFSANKRGLKHKNIYRKPRMPIKSENMLDLPSAGSAGDHKKWSASEILEYRPVALSEVFGHQTLKQFIRDRLIEPFQSYRLLVSGSDGSGKQAIIDTYIRLLLCGTISSPDTPACGSCFNCRGIKSQPNNFRGTSHHFWRIDGATTSQKEIKEFKMEFAQQSLRRIVQIDNMHQLKRRKLEHLFLLPIAEAKNTVWIASTADYRASDRMIRRRFLHRSAECLTIREKANMLKHFMLIFNVNFDSPRSVEKLVKQKTSLAMYIKLFAEAAKNNYVITEKMVASV